MNNLIKEVQAAMKVGTPIVSLATFDWQATIKKLCEDRKDPACVWDHVQGFTPINEAGREALQKLVSNPEEMEASSDPVEMLKMAVRLPPRSLLFMVNSHNYVKDPAVSTGIGILREEFKRNFRCLILLCPETDLPLELQQDVVLLRDPLPDDGELEKVAKLVFEQSKMGKPSKPELKSMIAAGRGLSTFNFEQQTFMSIRRIKKGTETKRIMGLDALWARKVEAVNATPGLEMHVGAATNLAVRGLKGLINYFKAIAAGPDPIGAVGHIDELDKGMAGAGAVGIGDSSGVAQEQLGVILKRMEDSEWDGGLYVGLAGVGKSLISKTIAHILGVPYIYLDLGACKDSLVGESEKKIRFALEVMDKIGKGRVFINATCNRLDTIPPELKRRFTSGIWFFDIPGSEDSAAIWALYKEKYGLEDQPTPSSDKWTGAEIRNACRTAYRLKVSLAEAAAKYVIPIVAQDPESINRLRGMANGRFLDAANGGTYHIPMSEKSISTSRTVEDNDKEIVN